MADNSRRGRNRPDSRAMWDESSRRNRGGGGGGGGGGARDRRDDRDRYRGDAPRGSDRRQRSRSRSPITERRERHRSRSRSRDRRDRNLHDRDRRRGFEGPRDKLDGHRFERERDGRFREDGREDNTTSRGPARRGDPRYSASPTRSPLGKVGRASHDPHSPLPTRSKNIDKIASHSAVRDGHDDDGPSRKHDTEKNRKKRDTPDDDNRRGRRPDREKDSGEDAMDEDEDEVEDLVVEDDEMSAMQAMMGFGGFGSTKGQKVANNNVGAVYKTKKTEYRQYMNRVGGFNRPLSPGR